MVIKDCEGTPLYTLTQNGYYAFDLSGEGTDDFELYWGDNFGLQLEAGERFDISFWVHQLQDEEMDFSTPQSHCLIFEVHVIQWNEY